MALRVSDIFGGVGVSLPRLHIAEVDGQILDILCLSLKLHQSSGFVLSGPKSSLVSCRESLATVLPYKV